MKKNKGFTLIELLVVIAIIGILAAIVLVSLRNARQKAKDARIIGDLSQMRSVAEMLYTSGSNYNGLCTDANFNTLNTDINTQSGSGLTCNASGDNYCVSSKLASNSSAYYCVGGAGKTGNNNCASATACD